MHLLVFQSQISISPLSFSIRISKIVMRKSFKNGIVNVCSNFAFCMCKVLFLNNLVCTTAMHSFFNRSRISESSYIYSLCKTDWAIWRNCVSSTSPSAFIHSFICSIILWIKIPALAPCISSWYSSNKEEKDESFLCGNPYTYCLIYSEGLFFAVIICVAEYTSLLNSVFTRLNNNSPYSVCLVSTIISLCMFSIIHSKENGIWTAASSWTEFL